MKRGRPAKPLKDRFELGFMPEPNSGCWLWLGGQTRNGYGVFHPDRLETDGAHRVAYKLYCAEIPEGYHVLHKCDVPSCVNPDHLFVGTRSDNMKDMWSKGRGIAGRKFTREDVLEIKRLLASGKSQYQIAAVYGVSQTAISKICTGIRWKDVA